MKNFIRKSVIIIMCSGAFNAQAKDTLSQVKLVEGRQYPICQELYKIVRRPENEQILNGAISVPTDNIGSTLTSPEYLYRPHDNFKPIEWQPVSPEEVKQNGYYSEPLKARFENEKRILKNLDANVYAQWKDQLEDTLPIFTKASLDFNFDGQKESVLRYRSPWSNYWSCYFPPDAPDDFKDHNGLLNVCNIVRYKGRNYVLEHSLAVILNETSAFTIPSQQGDIHETAVIPICKIAIPIRG